MKVPRLSTIEMRVMEALWTRGPASVRELQEAFLEAKRLRTPPFRRWSIDWSEKRCTACEEN